jgi:hypothetical protein
MIGVHIILLAFFTRFFYASYYSRSGRLTQAKLIKKRKIMLKLQDYLSENGIGHNFFARKIKCSPPTLHRVLRKGLIPNLKLAFEIQNATKGLVNARDWLSNEHKNNDKIAKDHKTKDKKIND